MDKSSLSCRNPSPPKLLSRSQLYSWIFLLINLFLFAGNYQHFYDFLQWSWGKVRQICYLFKEPNTCIRVILGPIAWIFFGKTAFCKWLTSSLSCYLITPLNCGSYIFHNDKHLIFARRDIIDYNAFGWDNLFNVKEGRKRISFVYYGNSCDKFAQ